MTAATITILNFGAPLVRWPVSDNPDEVGTQAFWQEPLDQMYALQPFKILFETPVDVFNLDHPEQDRRRAVKQWCLEDYNPDTPEFEVADGLTASKIEIAVIPVGYQPGTYTGQARPITEEARRHARQALSHEKGHDHQQNKCRYNGTDAIAGWIRQWWQANRPKQAQNEYEDWAEEYRGILGANEVRGTYSDGKPCTPTPERRSFMTCVLWLAGNLAGKQVHDFAPMAGGVMYQALFADGWHWRWIGLDWRSKQWDGQVWQNI